MGCFGSWIKWPHQSSATAGRSHQEHEVQSIGRWYRFTDTQRFLLALGFDSQVCCQERPEVGAFGDLLLS